jgi:predicted cupin superfamily sugar epimerase
VRRLETEDAAGFALLGCTVAPGYDDEDIETKTYGEIVKELGKE